MKLGLGLGLARAGSGERPVVLQLNYTPGSVGATNTRATTGTQADTNSLVQTAAINALRDANYIGGVRTALVESARTNLLTGSNDYSATYWTQGGCTSAQNLVGPDGVANTGWTLTDASASDVGLSRTLTVPNDTASYTRTVYLKKVTAPTTFPEVAVNLNGGTSVNLYLSVHPETGATTSAPAGQAGVVSSLVTSAGDYWKVRITVTNNATGNTSVLLFIRPAVSTVFGVYNPAAQGSVGLAFDQFEAAATSSSYFPTVASSLARATDVFSFASQPLSGTYYERWLDRNTGVVTDSITPYVGGAAITPALDRAYTNIKVSAGPETLTRMRAAA